MKRSRRIISLLLVLACLAAWLPVNHARAAVISLPSSLYLTQTQSGTCTLCSAAMMLRSRLYLNGSSDWSTVTETAIRSTAWMEGTGLRWTFTYSGLTVNHASVRGISVSELKAILDKHPEGIVLYCGNLPHALFLIGYSGDTFYCAETVNGYSGKQITLAASYLGKKYGNQANVLSNVTAYWYIASSAAETCTCSEDYAGSYICTTSTSNLTIRGGHGTSYASVGTIPPGATVTVSKASGTGDSDWAHVEYNGVSGYASMQYLHPKPEVNIHVSDASVSLSLDGTSSDTVSVWLSGIQSEEVNLTWSRSGSGVSCVWGDWKGGKLPLTITAKAPGTASVTVSALDPDTEKVLASVVIAVAVDAPEYTVSYAANGGSGTPEAQVKVFDQVLTLSDTVPTRFGYTFLGWGTRANQTDATYRPGDSFTANADTTLYAVWKGATRIPASAVSQKLYASIHFSGGCSYYSFMPAKAGEYTFESTGAPDGAVYLYDADGSLLASDDDGGTGGNFLLKQELTGGVQYYIKVMLNGTASGTVSLSVTRNVPVILQQSADVSVKSGEKARILLVASGKELTYEWYYANAGSNTFQKTNTFTSNRYSVDMNAARNGRRVYCVITDRYGDSVQTDTVTLSMRVPLAIKTQPVNVTARKGETAQVTVKAEGEGLTYEWYYANAGSSTFLKTDSFKSNRYSVTMNASRSGRRVYCVITDKYGNTVKTNTVTLTMKNTVRIITQPTNVAVASGELAQVTVKAEGDGLTYEWYYANAGSSTFKKTTAFGSNRYSVGMNASRSGRRVYCVITDKYGNQVKTNTVTLSMK